MHYPARSKPLRRDAFAGAAINDHDRNHAVTTIRDALGITDDEVADYPLPDDWSGCDREQRAKLLGEWLTNELRYMRHESRLAQQVRQLGDTHRYAPRLISRHELGSGTPARFFFIVDVGQREAVAA